MYTNSYLWRKKNPHSCYHCFLIPTLSCLKLQYVLFKDCLRLLALFTSYIKWQFKEAPHILIGILTDKVFSFFHSNFSLQVALESLSLYLSVDSVSKAHEEYGPHLPWWCLLLPSGQKSVMAAFICTCMLRG